jgi:diaminopimelate epimerase
MEMGRPTWREEEVRFRLALPQGEREATLLNAGNPQCAVFVEDFNFDWAGVGALIESHTHFPNRTNVSFVRAIGRRTLDVRFYERGAGVTMSSGTGSTGAVWAALLRGLVESPVRVETPGGPLDVRWDESVYLTGPAEIVGRGEFYFE